MSKNTGEALGFNNIFGGVGIGIGALTSGYLVDNYGWESAFMIPGLISILIGLSLVWHLYNGQVSLKNINSEKFSDNPEKGDVLKIIIITVVLLKVFLKKILYFPPE